jgi:hypothetical protein
VSTSDARSAARAVPPAALTAPRGAPAVTAPRESAAAAATGSPFPFSESIDPPIAPAIRAHRSSRPASRVAPDDALRREVAAMARLRALAATDPSAAVRLSRQIAGEFPDGMLGEERDALAVVALARAGRGDEARASAARYVRRYPRGPHLARVRAVAGLGAVDTDRVGP